MVDHLRNTKSVAFEDIEILVLDEADRLLDMGFTDEVTQIIGACPRGRQTMLFSATFDDEAVKQLVDLALNNPVLATVNVSNNLVSTLSQEFIRVRAGADEDREAIMMSLVMRSFTDRAIIFFTSKKQCHRCLVLFKLFGLSASELHGNLTQLQRLEALERFRDGEVSFLVRGLPPLRTLPRTRRAPDMTNQFMRVN